MNANSCACCGGKNFASPAHTDGGEYRACLRCGTAYQRGSLQEFARDQERFSNEQQQFYGDDSIVLTSSFDRIQSAATARRLSVVRGFLPRGRLLEVGPGSGKTLLQFKQAGYDIEGVEYSAVLASKVAAETGARVYHGDFNRLSLNENYDAYLSFHVIEHVPDFIAHLTKAASIVRPGGYAFIATPNIGSLECRISRGLAPCYSSAHLQLFSNAGLQMCLRRTGWQPVENQTPEYPTAWFRVATSALRKLRGKKSSPARGGYLAAAGSTGVNIAITVGTLLWPLRKAQELLKMGDELFIVARKL